MRRIAILSLCTLVCGLGLFGSVWQAKAAEPKWTTKEIMKKGHTPPKSSLATKVIKGEASPEEKKLLLEMYEAMALNKPPKGDEESWKKLTSALIEASKGVVEGKEGAAEKLNEAVNCGNCHKVHKA